MKILDRYLGRIVLQYTLITMLVLLGLYTFISFIDQLSYLGKGNYNLKEAATYVMLVIPSTIYELFPMATLVGTIVGLSLLANDSELVIMRASGVSKLQITTAVLKIGGVFVLMAILIGELIAPHTQTWAERGRAEALEEDIKQHTNFGLWMKDLYSYVNIEEVLPDLTIREIIIFEFDENRTLHSVRQAKKGVVQKDYWILEDVRQTILHTDGPEEISNSEIARWKSRVTPEILSAFLIKPSQLTFHQLKQYISHLVKNQQKTDPYELVFWNKITLPIATALMVVLAIPFVFTNIRSGALGRNLFIGIMLGIGFYVFSKGLGFLVLANGISPFLGATTPVISFLLVIMFMMRRIR